MQEKIPEEKGKLVNVVTVIDEHDMSVGFAGAGESVGFSLTIKEKTIYKAEMLLSEEMNNFPTAIEDNLVVDLYDSNYDRIEQQSSDFIREGEYDYCFYFDSGDLDDKSLDGYI